MAILSHGSIRRSGTLSGTREYGAFGENVAATGVGVLDELSGIPFGFSTKYQDRLTGHYYYGYRFYDANTGRWLSRDPIEERGGLNLYAFVGNNGVNQWDLLGMKECKCGPDVTLALRRTLQVIGDRFRALSPEIRKRVCTSFVGLASWDITTLKTPIRSACGNRDSNNNKSCKNTVTVEGGCHDTGSVNYILYGRMFRLCEKWTVYMNSTIFAYKGGGGSVFGYPRSENYEQSLNWADVGNNNWAETKDLKQRFSENIWMNQGKYISPAWEDIPDSDSGFVETPASNRKHCEPCSEVFDGVLHGHAGGMNW